MHNTQTYKMITVVVAAICIMISTGSVTCKKYVTSCMRCTHGMERLKSYLQHIDCCIISGHVV